jgi:lipoate-protein ligase A
MQASTSAEFLCTAAPLAGPPELDHAISRALLARVASGELRHALRIWSPVPALALSRLDLLREGCGQAVAIGRSAGLAPIRRLSGGHAVIVGAGSLCVGFAEPSASFEGTQARYERLSAAIVGALAATGVAAEHGELEREWCPGTWSIRSGAVKLAGLAQRAIKGGAWVEAVIDLAPAARERELLGRVYETLGVPLDLGTFGSVAELTGAEPAFGAFASALAAELEPHAPPAPAPSPPTMRLAPAYAAEFALASG